MFSRNLLDRNPGFQRKKSTNSLKTDTNRENYSRFINLAKAIYRDLKGFLRLWSQKNRLQIIHPQALVYSKHNFRSQKHVLGQPPLYGPMAQILKSYLPVEAWIRNFRVTSRLAASSPSILVSPLYQVGCLKSDQARTLEVPTEFFGREAAGFA